MNIRSIVFSQIEPEFTQVGWLSYEDGRLVLKFFTNDAWESISGSGGSSGDINVVDVLTSTSRYDALSANQGRYLKSLIDNIPTSYNWSSIIDAPNKLSQFTNDLPLVNTTENGLMAFTDKIALNNLKNEFSGVINTIDSKFLDKLNEVEASLQSTVTDAVATKAAKPLTISSDEVLIGSYNLDANSGPLDIYEKTITLNNLPVVAGNTQEYVISDEPLGFGLFFSVDSFSVSSGKGLAKEFFQFNYQVTRFYINSNLQSCVVIKCINNVSETVYGILHIQYCKFYGDVIEFDVTTPNTIDKSTINLEIPELKFNKKLIFSYINDDTYSIFQYIFSAINKRLIVTSYKPSPDDSREMFWHLNMENNPTEMAKIISSYSPTDFLQCTDGAGIKRRFSTTVATWPDKLVDTVKGIGADVGGFDPWISEKEFKYFKDFGFMLGYHDLNGYDSTTITQALFDICMANTIKSFNDNVGITPKLMIEPNGDHAYLTFCQNNPTVQVMTAQSGIPLIKKVYPFASDFTLNKNSVAIEREFYAGDNTTYPAFLLGELAKFNSTTDPNTIYWLIGSAHRSDIWETNLFTQINNLYGEKGNDSIWVPTLDEMYEYTFMRQGSVWQKTITDTGVHFKMYIPKMPNFFFRDLSVLLSGISDITGIFVSSGNNVYGTSYALNDGKLLINLDFNSDLLAKVEKYVSDYEANYTKNYKYDDAYYFIQKLKPGLRTTYLNRINVHNSPPVFTAISINSGATSTQDNNISVAFTYTGEMPTYYMLSEHSDFSGANWIAYSSPVSFILSDGYTNKTIYAKLKNAYGESNSLNSTITYNEPTLALSSISIVQGSSTSNQAITIAPSFVGVPTQYMISESSDFTGAAWVDYTSGNITYNLSSGYGLKTIYIKLENAITITDIKSVSINYIDASTATLNSISINSGATETDNGTVSIAISTTNTITKYKIGKQSDLSDCPDWITWNGSPVSFVSGLTNGSLTVYVQVGNTTSQSDIKSSTINIIPDVVLSAIVLDNFNTSHEGLTVPVSFTIASGTPTHYRLAETTDALNSATWIAWTTGITYVFTSLGAKTLYAQVKNSVSQSTVVNDTITLVAAPVVILLANVHAAGNIDGVGYVNPIKNGSNSLVLKDTQGTARGNQAGSYRPYNSTIYTAFETKYSPVTLMGGDGNSAYWNTPTLPTATGYPNSIIWNGTDKNIKMPMTTSGQSNNPTNRQPLAMLSGLAAGNYKVRILLSNSNDVNFNGALPTNIQVNDQVFQVISTDVASKIVNNNTIFYTVDSVTVDSDGYMLIAEYMNADPDSGWVVLPPVCVIEITKL